MRTHLVFLLFFSAQLAYAQPYFARFYTFPDGSQNSIEFLQVTGDTLLFRMNSADADPGTLETRVATMQLNSTEFNQNIYLPKVEAGSSMLKDGSFYLLPSEDRSGGKHITLNRLDENFSFVDSVHLKLADKPYNYFVRKIILYNDKYIVTGTAQNTTGFAFSRTVIFILNKDLTLHDTRIIEPVRQVIKPIDFAINPIDGKLYLPLVYDNFDPQDSTFVPAPRFERVIAIDSSFVVSDFWHSDEYLTSESFAPIAFSPTGTLYTFCPHPAGYDNMFAVDASGQEIWKSPLDSSMVAGSTIVWLTGRSYNITDIVVASNGDILAAGYVEEVKYNIGRSSFLARLRPDGTIKWTRIYRSNNLFSAQGFGYASILSQVVELPNGDIIAGGYVLVFDEFAPNPLPRVEAWLLHADSNGCISPACGYIQDAVQKLNYLPVVRPDNEWTVAYSDGFTNSRRKYRFSPDTVLINGQYHYELTYDDSFFGYKSTGRYYREENGIVHTSAGEVVYNLNLGTTDTLPSNQGANQGTRVVVSVGTAIYNDGIPRKTMRVQCVNDSLDAVTVVEGIGNLEEFFRSEVQCINPLDGPSNYILCYSVGGEIVYMKPGESCDLSSTNFPGNPKRIAVYPNPASDWLYINCPAEGNPGCYYIQVYNTLGMVVMTSRVPVVGDLLSVEIAGLPSGSYWGAIRDEDGHIYPFSFIRSDN